MSDIVESPPDSLSYANIEDFNLLIRKVNIIILDRTVLLLWVVIRRASLGKILFQFAEREARSRGIIEMEI